MPKNIFESTFDSFELNDGFLLKVDDVLGEHDINCTGSEKKTNKITVNKSKIFNEKNNDKKMQFEDLSIFLEDLNESDFFEQIKIKPKNSFKVTNNVPNIVVKAELSSNGASSSLSPILLSKSKNKMSKSFTSTPLRQNFEKKKKLEENCKVSEYEYLEADLFDDWGVDVNSQKDSITLSQAFKLIEEAESARESNEKEDLNTSVDLLTGNPITGDEDMFAESFSLQNNSVESKEKQNDGIITVKECNSVSKSSAAQKLDFKAETIEESNFKFDFNSDDDFDFLTQELLKKPKSVKTQLICLNPEESSEAIVRGKKCCRIIESDSADDSPDRRWIKKKRKQKTSERNAAREFIDSEAEVSDVVAVSSDESEEEGDYDASFVDEALYLTQNSSVDMTAKYLESVKNSNRPGQFKIPAAKPYNPANVFSQVLEESNTEYELNSFCVNEVEEEAKEDLSDLEIAEHILEMNRKERKRKRILK